MSDKGAIIGSDICGTVEGIGAEVGASVKKGDLICGFISGGNVSNHEDGAFAEYAVVKDGLFIKVPPQMSAEAASTLGLGLITCGQALYQALQLPWPNQPASEAFPILIYGGSSATGMLAIQLAKRSGLTVFATASKRNFELLKMYGADEVFDYNDPECASKICNASDNKLHYVFDTVSHGDSLQISFDALAPAAPPTGLHYAALAQAPQFPRDDVRTAYTWAYFATGETFEKLGKVFPGRAEDYLFAKTFMKVAEDLVAAGKVNPVDYTLRMGDLSALSSGLDDLRNGRVSGTKLVYQVASKQ